MPSALSAYREVTWVLGISWNDNLRKQVSVIQVDQDRPKI